MPQVPASAAWPGATFLGPCIIGTGRYAMKKRLLYGSGLLLLIVSATLVIWQGSFDFGGYAPIDPTQTFIFWAVSTLIFLLMVTLGFMLVRIGVKLYIERRSNREGSRIKTKLVIGALALSSMPVFFMVLFSYHVLNRNLDKWFSKPVEGERLNFIRIAKTLEDEVRGRAEAQAVLVASRPQTQALVMPGKHAPRVLEAFCREENVTAAAIESGNGVVVDQCGPQEALRPS